MLSGHIKPPLRLRRRQSPFTPFALFTKRCKNPPFGRISDKDVEVFVRESEREKLLAEKGFPLA